MTLPCIVHLDLKGAPWKLEVLKTIIPFMKANGASGVLIEWEDTFPYKADLIEIGSLGGCSRDGMYSMDEVKSILKCIKDCGMEPIQLIQSIGHLEFVLKHGHYRRLRELPRSPAVLCPSRSESCALIKSMLQQVLDAQPDAYYIHIGADEVWHINLCADCQLRSQAHEHGSANLYLEHIKGLATFIKTTYPKVNVLMWDDMIRSYSVETMKAYNMGSLVQPVVWNYNVKETFQLDFKMWERYSFVFPRVWVASAFKGANGSAQMICSAQHYASNQMAWSDELSVYSGELEFAGIILTGWSRFDHYAALCELLPEALPSLVTCLRMWTKPDGFDAATVIAEAYGACAAAGAGGAGGAAGGVAGGARAAHALRARAAAFLDGHAVTAWLNPWQIAHDYTSPIQMENIAATARQLINEFEVVRSSLSAALHAATGRRSAEEFVQTYVAPTEQRVRDLLAAAEARAAAAPGVTPKADKRRQVD